MESLLNYSINSDYFDMVLESANRIRTTPKVDTVESLKKDYYRIKGW